LSKVFLEVACLKIETNCCSGGFTFKKMNFKSK
jgi:hypothetical protein